MGRSSTDRVSEGSGQLSMKKHICFESFLFLSRSYRIVELSFYIVKTMLFITFAPSEACPNNLLKSCALLGYSFHDDGVHCGDRGSSDATRVHDFLPGRHLG